MDRGVGPVLVLAGVAIAVLGLLVWSGGLSWFGRLPGDLRLDRGSTQIFVPITSMVLLSVALTVVVNLVGRFLR